MQDLNEIEIVQRLTKGSEEAFNELFNRHHQWAVAVAVNSCAPYFDDAEDVVQDAFVKIWLNREKINPQKSFRGYLFTILRNGCRDIVKSRSSRLKLFASNIEVPTSTASAARDLESKDYAQKIHEAIQKLPRTETREVMKMYYMDGLNYKEISQQTGKSQTSLRSIVSRGVQSLKEFLQL